MRRHIDVRMAASTLLAIGEVQSTRGVARDLRTLVDRAGCATDAAVGSVNRYLLEHIHGTGSTRRAAGKGARTAHHFSVTIGGLGEEHIDSRRRTHRASLVGVPEAGSILVALGHAIRIGRDAGGFARGKGKHDGEREDERGIARCFADQQWRPDLCDQRMPFGDDRVPAPIVKGDPDIDIAERVVIAPTKRPGESCRADALICVQAALDPAQQCIAFGATTF